jgi:hypothetical protein
MKKCMPSRPTEKMTTKPGLDRNGSRGEILEVFDVYDDGLVWVSLNWKNEDGTTEIHAIAVDSEAIELVQKHSKPG